MAKFNIGGLIEGTAYGVLNEILSGFRSDDGYAKPSRYEVTLHPPSGVGGSPKGTDTNIMSILMPQKTSEGITRQTSLRCESISFPGRTLDTTADVNLYGPLKDVVTGYTYGDITGVFQCSTDMRERTFFETWQRLSFDNRTFAMEYYDKYVGSIDIHQLDENNKKRFGVKILECFPSTVAEQQLSYAPATEIQKVSVTFKYRYFKNLTDEADLPKPLLNRIGDVVLNGVEREIRSKIPKVLTRL